MNNLLKIPHCGRVLVLATSGYDRHICSSPDSLGPDVVYNEATDTRLYV